MNQLLILCVLGAVFVDAKEEPFSIGLGVLSPSYTQTVGKENVKVQFDQKENGGFSYSVGDPKSGTNTYLSFGEGAGAQHGNSAGYAAPAPAYNDANSYSAPAQPAYSGHAGYAAPAQAAYNGPTGYASQAPAYNGFNNHAPQAPAYSGFNNHAPQDNSFYGNNGFQARKPEKEMGSILPAGFSYHATDGQAFLGSMGESPTFMVEDSNESARGPAEQSFFHQGNNQRGLVNGLVGYGPGGPARGDLPIGGYAGPQFQGAHREHGGHTK